MPGTRESIVESADAYLLIREYHMAFRGTARRLVGQFTSVDEARAAQERFRAESGARVGRSVIYAVFEVED